MVFSTNIDADKIVEARNIFPVEVVDKHEKYLRLPTKMGWFKKEVFSWIRERLWAKTRGFGKKYLSKVGND